MVTAHFLNFSQILIYTKRPLLGINQEGRSLVVVFAKARLEQLTAFKKRAYTIVIMNSRESCAFQKGQQLRFNHFKWGQMDVSLVHFLPRSSKFV